jgi:hypothetical protein
MNRALDLLTAHGFATTLLGLGLAVLLVAALARRRSGGGFAVPAVLGAAVAVLGAGGLSLGAEWGVWVLLGTLVALFLMLVVLVASSAWWAPLGWAAAFLLALGLGGLWVDRLGTALAELGRSLRSTEFTHPWWLLLLLLLPVIVAFGLRSLDLETVFQRRKVESIRPWVSLLLRCLLVVFLTLALAEPRLRQANEHITVLFLYDRSQSIPEEFADDPALPGGKIDRRARRVLDFINKSVESRGRGHERDRAGLIVFGRRPRLELPPSDAPHFRLKDVPAVDGNYTDIAAALKLAMASFPEDTGKRIVLISDGNENLGAADEQARLAALHGVQIDVLPLAAGRVNEDEVLVERVDAPPLIEQGTQVPIRVLVRSYNPNIVLAKLTLRQITEGQGAREVGKPQVVKLRQGLNSFSFTREAANEQQSYTYEAEVQPLQIVDEEGNVLVDGRPPGDRVQNNRASTHVVARGRRRILLLEGKADDHQFLVERLLAAGDRKFQVVAEPVTILDRYRDRDKLAVFLSNFDCVILANVAADQVSEEQQEVLRSNTHDQGCGLVMIGGPEAFGAGGWQNTAVEKALPVDSDIKSLKVQGKGGLVLIMHASEMADGNFWQKKIAKLAIEKLGPVDEVGVIDFGMKGHDWVIKLQPIGGNKAKLLAEVDKMSPGDMPDFDPALKRAHDALIEPERELATKHVIVISDGDPLQNNAALLPAMRKDKITVTTVGVACHGPNEDQKMAAIAKATGGRAYSVRNPNQLPAIYIKESRLVSQSFVQEKRFQPIVTFRGGPTAELPEPPALKGFVRTTPKNSPLVEVPIITPKFADQEFPLLAYWHYGLGKAVAFTSDAGDPKFWSREWAEGGGGRAAIFAKFWEQVLDWSLRPTESKRLAIHTEYRDGKIRVTVEARTDDGKPDVNLRLRGGVTGPGPRPDAEGQKQAVVFVQKNSGMYEAEIKAEEAGSYFITAQATRTIKVKGPDGKEREVEEGIDSVRTGVTLPYSPEFSDLETNTALLERLRERTDGVTYRDDDDALAEAVRAGLVFRPGLPRLKSLLPLWHWLLFLTGVLLLADVAVRRLALDPVEVRGQALRLWARLRGRSIAEPEQAAYFDRLQSRKARLGEEAARGRAAARFDAGAGGAELPLGADATGPAPPAHVPGARPAAGPGVAPQPEPDAADYASRLLKAKKKVWEERNKEKPDK